MLALAQAVEYDGFTMKVAIIGYGGMGREVEKVLLDRGHEVSARVDPVQKEADAKELTEEIARNSDMAIEFSHAGAVLENARGLDTMRGFSPPRR